VPEAHCRRRDGCDGDQRRRSGRGNNDARGGRGRAADRRRAARCRPDGRARTRRRPRRSGHAAASRVGDVTCRSRGQASRMAGGPTDDQRRRAGQALCGKVPRASHALDTGMRVQACGDAHLGNFGVFGTPERNLVFDVNASLTRRPSTAGRRSRPTSPRCHPSAGPCLSATRCWTRPATSWASAA
jgi:hypothetical protein